MSDESFLRRWSRRKQHRTEEPQPPPPTARTVEEGFAPAEPSKTALDNSTPASSTASSTAAHAAEGARTEEEPVDPATLPPIESLGASSDYTVFLRPGVPEALRVAALRKAWLTDPLIRDLRHPAEYAWDFTTSEFDLRAGDDVAKMLDGIFRGDLEPAEVVVAPQQCSDREAVASAEQPAPPPAPASAEPQEERPPRRHGTATPE
jgi:hypothetical protein